MIEITNQNFNKEYPELEETLKNASFIAIDGEFTGIESDDAKNSLFDTVPERYEKNRSHIQPYIIIQFGISAFQRVHDENKYIAKAYNFFLLPRSIPSKNRQFLWQIGALEFLTVHGFNFNKLAYQGISYVDQNDEAILQRQIEENTLLYNVEQSISYIEEEDVKNTVTQILEWLNTSSDEKDSFKIECPTPTLQYFMHKELRRRFPNIWTFSGNNMITVIKVPPESRKILEQEEGSILENVLLESYIGFSKVFKLLVTLKKPIIAHNSFLDFMFMHQQFYKSLPQKYNDFKNNIHQLFPTIYDTKFLSFELREILRTEAKLGKSEHEAYHILKKVYGDRCISRSCASAYFKEYNNVSEKHCIAKVKKPEEETKKMDTDNIEDITLSSNTHRARSNSVIDSSGFRKYCAVLESEKWKRNILSALVNYFTEEHGKRIVLGSPIIELATNLEKSDGISKKYHTAGWDAYFAGYIFIRMAHIFATKRYEQSLSTKQFTHTELMNSIRSYANCVNIIRANVSHLKFDGPEPKSTRPKWLYVKPLASTPITATQIAEKMSKFGSVDIKQYTPRRMLVAVANHGSARDILLHFKQNKELYVVPYSPIRHSPSVQLILWSSVIVSGGIFAWMLHQKFQRSS